MAKFGKKYRSVVSKVNKDTKYSAIEACKLVKETKIAKFDESVDVAIHLGVDPRNADQLVKGAVSLPHGTGKKLRIAVFAKGPKADEATKAGADIVGDEDLAAKIEQGFLAFDRVVASPDLMGVVGKLGKILGPRGLMPNPRLGTVTMEVGKAVTELKAGKIEFKTDKTGTVHAPIGRASFSADKLLENYNTLFQAIVRAKPATMKGQYLKKVTMSCTMGPGIRVEMGQAAAAAE